jgi:hypothetical protein
MANRGSYSSSIMRTYVYLLHGENLLTPSFLTYSSKQAFILCDESDSRPVEVVHDRVKCRCDYGECWSVAKVSPEFPPVT